MASPPGLPLVVGLDILPSDDPNNFTVNLRSKGRLPMAILGSESLDVTEIDVDSISIAGVLFPVKTPSVCDESGDGIPDLVIHVSRRDLIMALGLDAMDPDTVVPIAVEGLLLNGREFSGMDNITLVARGD